MTFSLRSLTSLRNSDVLVAERRLPFLSASSTLWPHGSNSLARRSCAGCFYASDAQGTERLANSWAHITPHRGEALFVFKLQAESTAASRFTVIVRLLNVTP